MERMIKLLVVMLLMVAAKANGQIKFDSIGLGQSYDQVMTFIDQEHSYELMEKDSLEYRIMVFFDSTQRMTVALYFDQEKMNLSRIHMEEPYHLSGKQEYKHMTDNMKIWADELHPHEILECYIEGQFYIEEILDAEADGVHVVKVQFPFEEKRMIVDIFMN